MKLKAYVKNVNLNKKSQDQLPSKRELFLKSQKQLATWAVEDYQKRQVMAQMDRFSLSLPLQDVVDELPASAKSYPEIVEECRNFLYLLSDIIPAQKPDSSLDNEIKELLRDVTRKSDSSNTDSLFDLKKWKFIYSPGMIAAFAFALALYHVLKRLMPY